MYLHNINNIFPCTSLSYIVAISGYLDGFSIQFQASFTKYVEEQNLLEELDDQLVSGTFSSVDQMNKYWNDKVGEIFDLQDFSNRLRTLLVEMKCPWDV